jgi:hypothetical protein
MTTFKAQTLTYALTILDKVGGVSLSRGKFLEFLELFETPVANDAQALSFFKSVTDNATVVENIAAAFAAAKADTAATSDQALLTFSKTLADIATATDLMARSFSRPGVTDATTATDVQLNHINKHAFDTATATDDLDGAASAEDDQEMQFTKTRTDAASVTDVLVRLLTIVRALSDTASITDTGLLRSQGYTTDFSYFLEDYVGVSRTL